LALGNYFTATRLFPFLSSLPSQTKAHPPRPKSYTLLYPLGNLLPYKDFSSSVKVNTILLLDAAEDGFVFDFLVGVYYYLTCYLSKN